MFRSLILALLLVGCGASPIPAEFKLPDLPGGSVLLYYTARGRCSAVALEPRLAVTARHCVEKSFGTLADPSGGEYRVDGVSEAQDADIAFVYTGSDMPVFSPVSPSPPAIGELVWIAGYGCGGQLGIRPGQWTAIPATERGMWQIVGDVCPGDSGGALWDSRGRLIGVLSAKHRSSLPIAWVVPLAYAADLL